MNKQPQSSTDLPENQKPQISILALLIMSLFIGLIAGAGVDKSYILPIVFISAVILISNRNKIANAVEPGKSPRQPITPAADDYYNWPESGQFACTIAAAPRQQVIQQLAQENGINPDDSPVTKTHILKARLITDNSNPFDSDVVHIDIDGRTVYYLSREESRSFHRRLDEKGVSNQIIICNAIISGGNEANNKPLRYTIKLDIEPF